MNALCYKTVFSKRLGALVAVGEHATSQTKGQGAGAASGAWDLGSMLRYVGVLTGVFAAASMAWSQTLPQGGRVSQGQVTISQSGQQMDITQSTSKAVVNWDSFDIGTHAKVNVVQPNSQSVLLNRVLSDNPTKILGQLQANGQVVLVNPKGIVVGSDGSVSASAFTASTLNISDTDFMAGNGRYTREGSTGEVINRGRIQVAPGGYVALLGEPVSNEGQIIAPQGAVALGAAETVTVPIGRTGKIKLELSPSSINASVANQKGGLIVAEGGQVYMQAAAIPSALASIVHSGSIDTSAAKAGEVHLLADGGHIRVDGQITANSTGRDPQNQPQPGGDIYIGRDKDSNVLAAVGDVSGAKLESQGGFVETSGQYLRTTGTRVLAKDWLLDPTDIIIASSAPSGDAYGDNDSATAGVQFNPGTSSTILASDIAANLNAGTNVTISTSSNGADAGNITVSSNISKTSGGAASLTLTAHNNIILEAGISSSTGALGLTLNAAGTGGISGNASGTLNTNGGVLTLNTANAAANGSLGGVISGAGAVTKTGSGTTTLTGANSYSGATTVSGGTLQIGGGGTAGTLGTGTVTNNAMLTFYRSNNITVANTITGTGGLTQSGTGITTLTGNNSYGGGTTINAGSVAFTDSSTALGTGPVGVNANGTLALRTTGTNQPKFANVLNGSGNITYSGSSGNQMFLSGDMSAFSGSFSINGTGTYIWFNNEGSQQARFVVNTGNVMGLWSRTSISGVATGGLNDGVRTFHAGSLTGSGKIQSDGGGTSKQVNLSIGTLNETDTFSGAIENTYSGGGNVVISIVKVGTGTQILNGANAYTGTTTITGGTLQIGSGVTSGSLGTGAVTNNAILTFNRSNNVTVANLISGSGALTKMGGGTTTLTAANTFTGTTLVSGGTLALGHVNALQNSTLDTGTSSTQQVTFTAAGSTYNIGALQGSDDLAIGTNSISVGGKNTSTNYSGVLSGTGNFSKVGNGTQILSGNNSYTGTTTVSGGTLQVGNAGSSGTLGSGNVTLSNNANLHVLRAADTTVSNTISGAGNVSASITGTGSDLSVTGPMSLTGGTVNLVADGNLSAQQALSTNNTTDAAIVLTAGKPTNAGTSSGGDVSMSGSGSLSTGTGGRATIYTGSLSGSTGLGITTGNNRYNSDESSTNYSATLGSGTYAIYREKPTITVMVNDASKTYDGVAFSGGSLNTTLSSGTLARSDSFTAVTANATLGGAAQGSKNAGQYAITASESGGKNALGYEVTYTSGQLTINQADLSVTANSVTKTYDGTTSATGTAITTQNTQLFGNDSLSGGTFTFSNKNASSGDKVVQVSGVTVNDGNNGQNYNVSYVDNTTSTITKKNVTLDSIIASNKTYDGSTTATITSGSISGTVGSETLAISGSGSFDNKNAADGKTVTVSDVTSLTQTDGTGLWSNYNLTTTGAQTTTANISKKSITLSGITADHKTYDGNTDAVVSVTNAVFNNKVIGDTLTVTSTGTFGDKDVGNSKTVTLSNTLGGADLGNYTVTNQTTTTANITKKEVTLSGITAAQKTYDGNNSATISAGSISGTVASETLLISGSGTFDNKDAANGKTVTVSDVTTLTQTDGTGSWSNYNLTTTGSKTTTANITKADLAVTANSVTKTYDGTTKATGTGTGTVGTLAGAAAGDVVSSSGSQAFLTIGAGNNKTVRASGVTIKDAANADMTDNYNITYTDNTTGVIQKAELTVTANDDARFVGLTDTPGFTGVSPTGWVNGEDMSVLGGTLSITRTNASTLAAGIYADVLSPSGLTSDNYNITFAKGTYTIVPADQLLIRNDNISSTYGSTWSYDPTAKYLDGSSNAIITLSRTGSGNNFTFNDGLGTTVSATFKPYSGTSAASTSSAGHTVVGSYKIKDANPTVVGRNFVGDPVFVGTLNVNTKALTPSTSGVSMVYNGTTAMSNLSMDVTGRLGTDSVSIQGSGTYSQKNVGTNLNYTIANLALGGTDAANYHIGGSISSITGTNGTITPATLKLSTSNVSKTYDGNTSASGTTMATQNTQLFGNDSLSGGTFAFSNQNASSGDKVVQVSAVTVNDGNNGQNYNVSYVDNTTSTITKKDVTLSSITAAHKTYDGNATATITSGSISGTVGSETLGISGSGSFDDKNVANSKTVTVSDVTTLTQADGTGSWINYNLTTTGAKTATANITPAAASISAPATSVIYNGQTQSQGAAVLSGFVAGDDVQAMGLASGRNAGSYASSLSATGADVGNYTITYNNAALTIDKRPASLSALGQTVVYNGQTQSLNGSQGSGFVAGDALTFGGLPSGRNVGQYTSAMTVSGADAANYDVTLGNATLTITPKGASVTARPERVTYNGQTQQQSAAVLEGFLAGDDIQVSGLASGRNAGVYGSNVLSSGQDVPNYSIRYQQGALTIDKAPLQFVGTSATSKAYDGNTDARVTAGTLSGLVGTETLNVDTVQGQFDSPEIGFAKPVQVVYGLSDGANVGLVSNYQWSPVTVQANITGNTTEHAPAPERIRQVNPFSRLSYLGFGGLVRTGATTGQLFYAIQNKDTRTCSPLQLEGCICEQAQEHSLQVCYPADLAQQAGN